MSSDDCSDSDLGEEEILRNLEKEGQLIIQNLLPEKSKQKYEMRYREFLCWKEKNKCDSFNETVFIVYFHELAKIHLPSTLWSIWSMLKTIMHLRHNINLSTYNNLKVFLKNKAKGYKPKKAKVLTLTQIKEFINKSDDSIYLATKVVLIFGVCGALRTSEICEIKTKDVEDTGTQLIVSIRNNKNHYPRSFLIGQEFYNIVKKYILLRPENMDTDRFFINYQRGKCIRQVMGKNKISEIPKIVALYLQLESPEKYTGHCFRRTGATLLANSGANLTTVKQLGGWRSSTVAEGYIEHSLANKKKIYDGIIAADEQTASSSKCHVPAQAPVEEKIAADEQIASSSKCYVFAQAPVKEKSTFENNLVFNTDEDSSSSPSHASLVNLSTSDCEKNKYAPTSSSIINSRRLSPLQEIQNLDVIRAKKRKILRSKKKHLNKIQIENEVIDSLTINTPFVTFKNCKFKQIIINNNKCNSHHQENN